MSASIDEMKEMLVEADARGDKEFATQLMDMIEGTEPAVQPEPELPEGNMLDSIAEPIQAVGAGVAGSVVGGLKGIAEGAFNGAEAGAEAVDETMADYAEMGAPETQAGQRGLETVQDLIQTGVDWARVPISGLGGLMELITTGDPEKATQTINNIKEKGFGKAMGDHLMDEYNSPILSTLAEISPEIVESVVGLGAMKGANAVGKGSKANDLIAQPRKLNPDVNPRSAERMEFKRRIADDIESGGTDSELARYMLDGAGGIKGDSVAKNAIKQGFDPAVVSAVKGANDVDRGKMLDMLLIMRRGKKNARFATENRPSDIAGDSLMERIKHIQKVNDNAGNQLDDVAKNLRGSYADFDTGMANFADSLDGMGISIDPKTFKADYSESILQGLKEPQKIVNNIVERLAKAKKRGQTPDAYDMHMLKKYIDENVTYGGKGGEGLKGKAKGALKKLRHDIDSSLDNSFDEYNRINTEYAETRGALDSFQDTAGRKMDLSSSNAHKSTGTLLRRLMSNYSNRVNLYDSLKEVDQIGKKYGGAWEDDLMTQILFADELDSQFGAVARTSLAGEVGKGVKKSLKERAVDFVGEKAESLYGINDTEAFDLMEELLLRRSQATPKPASTGTGMVTTGGKGMQSQ